MRLLSHREKGRGGREEKHEKIERKKRKSICTVFISSSVPSHPHKRQQERKKKKESFNKPFTAEAES